MGTLPVIGQIVAVRQRFYLVEQAIPPVNPEGSTAVQSMPKQHAEFLATPTSTVVEHTASIRWQPAALAEASIP